jgi:hypothetical protein
MFGSLLGCRGLLLRIAWTLLLLFLKGTFHGQMEPHAFSIIDFRSQLPEFVGGELGLG